MKATVKELTAQIGSLSNTDKMPGYSWGIPASDCKRGSNLREIEGSVCYRCYAMKGRYPVGNVQRALKNRLERHNQLSREQWCDLMSEMLLKKIAIGVPYFRIFDSGDLQSEEMLIRWCEIARRLPQVSFWMSTRERGIVSRVLKKHPGIQPDNLVIRVSADMIGSDAPARCSATSSVHPKVTQIEWADKVRQNNKDTHHCPASLQDHKCVDCRACWDSGVSNVVYLEG